MANNYCRSLALLAGGHHSKLPHAVQEIALCCKGDVLKRTKVSVLEIHGRMVAIGQSAARCRF